MSADPDDNGGMDGINDGDQMPAGELNNNIQIQPSLDAYMNQVGNQPTNTFRVSLSLQIHKNSCKITRIQVP